MRVNGVNGEKKETDEIKMMTKMVVRRSERRSGDQLDLRNRQKRGRKREEREEREREERR